MTARLILSGAAFFFLLNVAAWSGDDSARNPFMFGEAPPMKTEKPGEPNVGMILIKGAEKYAIIDGRRMAIGDALAGGVITGMTLNSVMVERNGKSIEYSVGGAP